MNVLSYGIPFDADFSPIALYRGQHDIRTLGSRDPMPPIFMHDHDYYFDLASETFVQIIDRIAAEWRPDLFLCWFPEKMPPPLQIEDSPVPTVALVSDWGYRYASVEYNAGRFDLVLCDKPGLATLANPYVTPHSPFPLYAQKTPVHRKLDVPKDLDIVYIGALEPGMRPRRSRFLERIARLSDRYSVFLGKGFDGEDYTRMLCRGRIVFNYCVRGELNLRVWETLACGSLLFVEDTNPEVRDYFEDGRDLVLYNSDNLEEKIAYYLEHGDEAEAIAARGLARAPEFAGENRFDTLIEWVAQQPGSGRRFRDLPEPDKAYHTLLLLGHSFLPSAQELETRLADHYCRDHPEDSRGWAALGHVHASPYRHQQGDAASRDRALKALEEAYRLQPRSAPHALNVATLCRRTGRLAQEVEYLHAVLQGSTLEGDRLVVGHYDDEFWVRWIMALPERRTSIDMLHAEAHIRLAENLEQRGVADGIVDHLVKALEYDPGNTRGVALFARALWAAGRSGEAVQLLQKYLPERPLDMNYRIQLARMLIGIGMDDESEALVQETERIAAACHVN